MWGKYVPALQKGEGQAIWNRGRETAGKVGPTRESAAADEDETCAIIACRFGQAVRDIARSRSPVARDQLPARRLFL